MTQLEFIIAFAATFLSHWHDIVESSKLMRDYMMLHWLVRRCKQ
jgi:hypothetical protein